MDAIFDPSHYADTVAEFWCSMPQFFPASSACDTLLRERLATTRERARQLCVAMAQDGVFLRVNAPPAPFVDDHTKWRLTWTSAEETRNNVLLQRALPVNAPPEALLDGPPDAPQFDDSLSSDSDNDWDRFQNHDDDQDSESSEEELQTESELSNENQNQRADPLALRTQLQLLQGKPINIKPNALSTNTSDSYVGSYSPTRSGSGIRYRNGSASGSRHTSDANIHLERDAYDANESSDSSTRAVPVAVPIAVPKAKLSYRRDRPKPKPPAIPPLQDNSIIVIPSSPRVPRGIRLDDPPPRPIANVPNPAFPRPPSFGSMRSVPKAPKGLAVAATNAADHGPLLSQIPLNPLQAPTSPAIMHSVPRGINLESQSSSTGTADHRRLPRGINLDKKLSSPGNSRSKNDAYTSYASTNGHRHSVPVQQTTTRTSFELHANVFDFPMSPPRSPSVDTVHCVPRLALAKIPVENNSMPQPPPPMRASSPSHSIGIDRRDGTTSSGSGSGIGLGTKVEVVPRNNRFSFDKYQAHQAQSQHNSLSSWDRQKFVRNSSFDALDNRKFTRNSSFDAMQAKRNASFENKSNNNRNSNSQQTSARKSSNLGISGTFEAAAPIADIPLTSGIDGSAKICTPLHVLAKQARGLDSSSHGDKVSRRKSRLASDLDARPILTEDYDQDDDGSDEDEDVIHGELDEKPVALPVEEFKGDDRKLPAPPKVIVEDVVQAPLDDTMEFELSPFGQDSAFDGPPAGKGPLPPVGGNGGGGRRKDKNRKNNTRAVDQPSVEKRAKMLGRERHLSEKRLANLPPLESPRRGMASSVGTATSTSIGDTVSQEVDIPLPNVGMIREKLKRAFQAPPPAAVSPASTPQHGHQLPAAGQLPSDTGKQHGKDGKHGGIPLATSRHTNGGMNLKSAGESKDGVSELSSVPARDRSSLPAEVSPVTTPRKPWRILRALSGRPPSHVTNGGNDEDSSTFTDSEGDGNETSNTIATNTTSATANGTNSLRTSKTQSLRERVLNSLRRSRRAGRDAYADRLERQMYDGSGNGHANGLGHMNSNNSSPHSHQSGQGQNMWSSR